MQLREQESGSARCLGRSALSPSNVDSSIRNLHSGYVLLVLFIVSSTLIRLPWFFHDVIESRDEGTFFLVGKALLDGYLPGELVLDLKPPLAFVFFAAIQALVPDSVAAIRLGGALWIALAASLVYGISLKLMPVRHSLVTALIFISAVSLSIPSGPSVMTQHIALVPLLGALLLTVSDRQSLWTHMAIGALLAIATLVRLNLAYVALAVVLATLLISPAPQLRDRLVASFWVGIGGLLVLAAVYLPYGLSGHSELFIDIFKVPLAYSGSQLTLTETFWAMIWAGTPPRILRPASPEELFRVIFWFVGGVGLVCMVFLRWQREFNRAGLWLGVYAGAISYSILASGSSGDHYLIQVMPLYAIGLGAAVCLFRSQSGRVLAMLTALFVISVVQQLWTPYQSLAERITVKNQLYHGLSFDLAAYLQQTATPGETYFFERDEIVYWILGTYPVAPIAGFAWNIWNEKGIVAPLYGPDATKEVVLEHIMSLAPDRIVLGTRSFEDEEWHLLPTYSGFGTVPEFREALSMHYVLEGEKFERLIFRRTSD